MPAACSAAMLTSPGAVNLYQYPGFNQEHKRPPQCSLPAPEGGQRPEMDLCLLLVKLQKEVRVLNRVIRCTADAWEYEADQRHADILVKELGLLGESPKLKKKSLCLVQGII